MPAYRIAIATSDNVHVDRHFGRADHFLIAEVALPEESADISEETRGNSGIIFSEERTVTPVFRQGRRDETRTLTNAEILSDCQYLLAARVGPNARYELNSRGIVVVEWQGTIPEALEILRQKTALAGILAKLKEQKG